MSGPKVDVASIRKQEQARLEAAREKRRDAWDKVQKNIQSIVNNGMYSEMIADNGNIMILRQNSVKELEKIQRTIQRGNELLEVEALLYKAENIVREFYKNVQAEVGVQNILAEQQREQKQLEKIRYSVEQASKRKVWKLTEAEETEVVVTETDVKAQEEIFVSELQRIMQSDEIPKKGRKTLLVLHQDLLELTGSGLPPVRKLKRMNRMLDEFEKTVNLLKNELQGMQEIYEQYCRECFDMEEQLRDISAFESAEEIREAIEEAKEAGNQKMSKEYIKRQIDEIMLKHGYDVVRSDMLTEANENGQMLYGVDADTAINVFVSEENQVTMRVVGIGFDTDISEVEDEKLFQQQCAFCSLHPQITAELEMRGVILHTKKHMPPDKKFNKKLQVKTKSDTQTQSRAKRELKRTEQKVMRKE